jgi:hypothetical protein
MAVGGGRPSVGRVAPVAPALTLANGTHNRQIFVAYPWGAYTNRETYKRAYTDLEKALAVKFVFAEQRFSDGTIFDKVMRMIGECAFGIYDVTGWNPNVTLEYGMARGMGTTAYIAFNPEKTNKGDVPTDVRGYDRLQYSDFGELSEKIATLVGQVLGTSQPKPDPLESDRLTVLAVVRDKGPLTARQITDETEFRLDYVQMLLRRSSDQLATAGQTKGQRYSIKPAPDSNGQPVLSPSS